MNLNTLLFTIKNWTIAEMVFTFFVAQKVFDMNKSFAWLFIFHCSGLTVCIQTYNLDTSFVK